MRGKKEEKEGNGRNGRMQRGKKRETTPSASGTTKKNLFPPQQAEMTHPRSVLLLILLSVSPFVLLQPTGALTPQEETALEALTVLFPDLLFIPRAAAQTYQPSIGGVWRNISDACSTGDGWYMHGVNCKGGRIVALFMHVAFLAFYPPFSDPFPATKN